MTIAEAKRCFEAHGFVVVADDDEIFIDAPGCVAPDGIAVTCPVFQFVRSVAGWVLHGCHGVKAFSTLEQAVDVALKFLAGAP